MQDNSKPCIFAVKDVYEMYSLASRYPTGTIYVVNNRCYISCENGSFALFDTAATPLVEEETRPSYLDEDTYRI